MRPAPFPPFTDMPSHLPLPYIQISRRGVKEALTWKATHRNSQFGDHMHFSLDNKLSLVCNLHPIFKNELLTVKYCIDPKLEEELFIAFQPHAFVFFVVRCIGIVPVDTQKYTPSWVADVIWAVQSSQEYNHKLQLFAQVFCLLRHIPSKCSFANYYIGKRKKQNTWKLNLDMQTTQTGMSP